MHLEYPPWPKLLNALYVKSSSIVLIDSFVWGYELIFFLKEHKYPTPNGNARSECLDVTLFLVIEASINAENSDPAVTSIIVFGLCRPCLPHHYQDYPTIQAEDRSDETLGLGYTRGSLASSTSFGLARPFSEVSAYSY